MLRQERNILRDNMNTKQWKTYTRSRMQSLSEPPGGYEEKEKKIDGSGEHMH